MSITRIHRLMRPLSAAAIVAIALAAAAADTAPPTPPAVENADGGKIDFTKEIQPLFQTHCYACHGPAKQKGGLRLDKSAAVKGGDSGEPILLPHDPEKSPLLKRVRGDDADELMPPKGKGDRLTAAQVDLISRWIKQGGLWIDDASALSKPKGGHWSFVAPTRPPVPAPASGTVRNPIDAFVLARLEKEGVKQSPEADRYALIRRATFDLTGLAPTLAEVEAFVSDKSTDAYEKLIDRLLANPHFGERWARTWLDLARYADSAGYGSDPLRFTISPYRDWVIESFNHNKPYDQFSIEQIAGDLLPNPTTEQLVATGFNRNTMTNTEGGTDREEFRTAAVKDRNEVTTQVWMGLTMGCAQCHTHKYDPITNREYYQMMAFFNQSADADRPDEEPKIAVPTKDQLEKKSKLEAEIAALESEIRSSPKLAEAQQKWESAVHDAEAGWTPLEIIEAKSKNGASLQKQADGSILASGTLPKTDAYTVTARTDLQKITAFRLEALPDDSLPSKGPGRAGNGSFILNEFVVNTSPLKEQSTQGMNGRYVRIELPGQEKILALAEVQVLAGSENLATGGKARQSSTDFDGFAKLAIDGNTDGEYRTGKSTSHTAKSTDPWWEVDLGAPKTFDRITIWNRTDEGVGGRLSNFRVIVLDDQHQPIWTRIVTKPPTPNLTIGSGEGSDVMLANASATWEQADNGGWTAAKAIDGDERANSGWAILPKIGMRQAAVFEVAAPVDAKEATKLTFRLVQNFESGALGRFRLSATTNPKPVRVLPLPVSDALAAAADQRTDGQKKTIRDEFLRVSPDVKSEFAKVAMLRKQLDDMRPTMTAVMRELPQDQRRKSHILVKGNFLNLGEEVQPQVLAAFHPLPAGAPANRLGLAQWLVARDNPLTARVEVNRIWAQFFGTGIVETQEDFGEMGAPPSHPELLDWLAVEFMEPTFGGSGNAWDMKRLMRLIVTSATYRQSAKVSAELVERDSRNRLLARMSRQRLEAEMVRDQALEVSGLLSLKMFGPSIFPPQPDGMWQAAFNGERTYPTSKGDERYRRGLYVFWRRTVPYPSMQSFDAPSREVCTVRRMPTNTPLQAFVTMNDPVYVECSQLLGARMVKEGGVTVEDRIRFGLKLVLQRPPTDEQISPLTKLYEEELEHYRAAPEDAKKLAGEMAKEANPAESAAWTVVANVLLNLDGAMTR